MTNVESIDLRALDATQPEGWCSCCRRELGPDEPRLELEVIDCGVKKRITICRTYLAEHMPQFLASELEASK